MYLPRELISHLYLHLVRNCQYQSTPVLILVALEPDALCACRILTALFKRENIPHNIHPVSGYGDLARAGVTLVQPMRLQDGGSGGTVVCLGVGGLVDLAALLGLEAIEEGTDPAGGVEIWIIDARRPWHLNNVFGTKPPDMVLEETDGNGRSRPPEVTYGRLHRNYRPGRGGLIVYDDGDIDEELAAEREAFFALAQMPDIEDNENESVGSGTESDDPDIVKGSGSGKKRKSWSNSEIEGDEDGDRRPRRRRRSNTGDSLSTSHSPSHRGLLSTSNKKDQISSPNASRSSSPASQPSSPLLPRQPSARTLRRRLLEMKRKHESVCEAYYSIGTSYSEPVSSLLYSLASEVGREDNSLLWHAIVGVSSLELYGRSMTGVGISNASDLKGLVGWGGERGERIRQVLRDEVRRLNPPDPNDSRGEVARGELSGVIPTTARSPTDNSIRLSPEPRFLLIRHWSLYDSMLHSPYLASKLHIWSDNGRKRLAKLLAKMGVSLNQSKQSYTHMDMELKRGLRQRLLKYAPIYGLDGLVPPPVSTSYGREGWGFVRSWGWKACLSAIDVGVIVGAILEVGKSGAQFTNDSNGWDAGRSEKRAVADEDGTLEAEAFITRFWEAYDALENVDALKMALPTAQYLHRAILRTGTSLISKRQIRHLRAFRMAVVKEGPDVLLFTHPSTLIKLALWLGEAVAEQEKEKGGKLSTPLVVAGLNESRGVYVVVGTGGAISAVDLVAKKERAEKKAERAKRKEARVAERKHLREEKRKAKAAARAAANSQKVGRASESDDEDEEEEEEDEEEDDDDDDDGDDDDDDRVQSRGYGKNRFGNAFQEVIDETNARVRIDNFEHCVVEVRKDDIERFLESLSVKAVVG